MEVWFGSWALATDNCAQWVGGFNDLNAVPAHTCEYVECPASYLDKDLKVDFDRSAVNIGPYGGRNSSDLKYMTISNGQCQTDSNFYDYHDMVYLG